MRPGHGDDIPATPVLYITQLLGLALGIPAKDLGLDALSISADSLLSEISSPVLGDGHERAKETLVASRRRRCLMNANTIAPGNGSNGNGDGNGNGQAPNGSVLVCGGGVAGIQAALDLSAAGFAVYLVEESPTIGGAMARLDKTFPTGDCATCIISPKLVQCMRDYNIEVITMADVQSLEGEAGAFKVGVQRRPRSVDRRKMHGLWRLLVRSARCAMCPNRPPRCSPASSLRRKTRPGLMKSSPDIAMTGLR